MSSSLSPMTAISPATGAFPPAFTKILRRTPPTSASISMLALSVSTSARMSPTLMVSPSFLFHLTIRPSSMVGESLARTTLVAIRSSSLLRQNLLHRFDDLLGLGNVQLLEDLRIGHGHIGGVHAEHRGV